MESKNELTEEVSTLITIQRHIELQISCITELNNFKKPSSKLRFNSSSIF